MEPITSKSDAKTATQANLEHAGCYPACHCGCGNLDKSPAVLPPKNSDLLKGITMSEEELSILAGNITDFENTSRKVTQVSKDVNVSKFLRISTRKHIAALTDLVVNLVVATERAVKDNPNIELTVRRHIDNLVGTLSTKEKILFTTLLKRKFLWILFIENLQKIPNFFVGLWNAAKILTHRGNKK